MKKINWKNKIVLGVNAHPDDLDFGAGGTIAKAVRAGATVYYAIFTDGDKGNSGDRKMRAKELVKTRRREEERAAKILGVKKVFYFSYKDCELTPTLEAKKRLVKLIRKLKPDILIGLDPSRYYSRSQDFIHHTDHRAAGEITIDAAYPMCRDRLIMPDAGPPHKVDHLLLLTLDDANYFEDIEKTFPIKVKAIAAHQSQVPDPKTMPKWFKSWAHQIGKKSRKYTCAESFRLIQL